MTRRFRDGKQARSFAKSLKDPVTVYDVRVRINGREVSRTFTRKVDADAWASTTEADKVRGAVVDPKDSRVTVKDYAEKWLAERHDLAATTRALYRHLLNHHIIPILGGIRIGNLSTVTVATIERQHPTTAAKAYRLLATIMKTAVEDRLIIQSPCRVKGAAKEQAAERPVASVAEVHALADAMPAHLRLRVLLGAWCQLRRAELLGLRRQDIDLLRQTVSIAVTRTATLTREVVEKPPQRPKPVAELSRLRPTSSPTSNTTSPPSWDPSLTPGFSTTWTTGSCGRRGTAPRAAWAVPISTCTTSDTPA
jgi:hypothetical protein